jgi:hypothetical protein
VRLLQQATESTVAQVLELRARVEQLIALVENHPPEPPASGPTRSEVSGIRQTVSDLSNRVSALAQCLDRQAEAFRALSESRQDLQPLA